MKIISLPVNIGAPAARNWLLQTDETQDAEYIAFLDDDVEIPNEWLNILISVMKKYPKAGVVGAKVINRGSPKRLQYLYRNIAIAKEDLIRLSLDTPNFNYDPKIYDFIRTTTTVMGCCHLFRREALDKVRFFDIRFSPSQMDDIAHDIDLRINGFEVIYCGLVECVHHQGSGIGRNTSLEIQKWGNVLGNDVKFFYRFYPYLTFLSKENNVANRLVRKFPRETFYDK
jgi:GT2 family glycosyltransferase